MYWLQQRMDRAVDAMIDDLSRIFFLFYLLHGLLFLFYLLHQS